MSDEFENYPFFEVEADRSATSDENDLTDVQSEIAMAGPCWSVSAFRVCVERWQNDRLTFGFYLYNVKIGQKTVKANDPCVKVKADVKLAKVDARICADFGKQVVIARGKICILGACARFNQIIFRW